MTNLCEAALSTLGHCFQPFSCRGPLFAESLNLGPLHKNLFQNSWLGVIMAMKQ